MMDGLEVASLTCANLYDAGACSAAVGRIRRAVGYRFNINEENLFRIIFHAGISVFDLEHYSMVLFKVDLEQGDIYGRVFRDAGGYAPRAYRSRVTARIVNEEFYRVWDKVTVPPNPSLITKLMARVVS